MSKTVDTLRRPVFKDDVLHSHIAETYFRQKPRVKTRKKKRARALNVDLTKTLIVILISLAVLMLLYISAAYVHKQYIDVLKMRTQSLEVINFINNGSINRSIISKFEFRGHARNIKNSSIKDSIILNSPKKYNWADLSINFKFPIDVSSRNLLLSVRGNTGGEKVGVVLRDIKNRSIRLNDLSLSSNTSDKVIRLASLKGDIDLINVNHLRLEFGYAGESVREINSPIDVTIYVNSISLTKEK